LGRDIQAPRNADGPEEFTKRALPAGREDEGNSLSGRGTRAQEMWSEGRGKDEKRRKIERERERERAEKLRSCGGQASDY